MWVTHNADGEEVRDRVKNTCRFVETTNGQADDSMGSEPGSDYGTSRLARILRRVLQRNHGNSSHTVLRYFYRLYVSCWYDHMLEEFFNELITIYDIMTNYERKSSFPYHSPKRYQPWSILDLILV